MISLIRRVALRTALVLVAVGVALCLGEVALRIVVCHRAGDWSLFLQPVILSTELGQPDEMLNHSLAPGATFQHTGLPRGLEFAVRSHINRWGLHDDDFPKQKAPGEIRVLVLGDSFVEARQIPIAANLCQRLERRIATRTGRPIQVINGGVSSYSPLLEYLFYKNRLRAFQPDVVVLMLFANDVFDDIRYTRGAVMNDDGYPTAVPSGIFWLSVKQGAKAARSGEYRIAVTAIRYTPGRGIFAWSYLASTIRQTLEIRRLHQDYPQPPFNEEFFVFDASESLAEMKSRGWALSERYVGLLKEQCDADHVPLLLTWAPIAAQVYGTRSFDHFFSELPPHTDLPEFREMAAHLHIPYIDLLTSLREAGRGLYFPHDGHWTRKGHRVAADALLPAIMHELEAHAARGKDATRIDGEGGTFRPLHGRGDSS